jgi:hypothetical protein
MVLYLGCDLDKVDGHGFRCGEPMVSDNTQVQTCATDDQVCICETRSCAMTTSKNVCPSGLLYTGVPYSSPDLPSPCVDPKDVGTAIDQYAGITRCLGDGGGGPSDAGPADAGQGATPADGTTAQEGGDS